MTSRRYKRVVVKLSGRAFAGSEPLGLDAGALAHVADELLAARELGIELVVVVGGGNFFRGNTAQEWGIEQAEADNVGMLGTVMNGILLRGVLKQRGLEDVRLMTALPMPAMAEPFIRLRALRHLERNRVVLLGCGIGQPYVTTDYPAAQRAVELGADAILLAKHGTDGIYDRDPRKDPAAQKFLALGYQDILEKDLRVMDQSAILLAREHNIPLHVFDFEEKGAVTAICSGEDRGTHVASFTTTTMSPVVAQAN
ncbi:UMP kinase [Kitasatospora sp. NBC_01560]|uniref:UMP kinase n=1 Tax=Kitasatospora sp. NBC_01560 TaxID=2975965 RepID=UPI00386F374F